MRRTLVAGSRNCGTWLGGGETFSFLFTFLLNLQRMRDNDGACYGGVAA